MLILNPLCKALHKSFYRLFFNSLIELINEYEKSGRFSKELFETEYSVEREFTTKKGKRIDIPLLSNSVMSIMKNYGFSSQLELVLEEQFFKHQNNFIKCVVTELKGLIKNKALAR